VAQDGDGGEPVYRTVMSDITDHKQTEAMSESNQYLDNLFNYANAPIIVWDPLFRITRFNPAFESLTTRWATSVRCLENQLSENLFTPPLPLLETGSIYEV
jgi:PAS domain-containing protein